MTSERDRTTQEQSLQEPIIETQDSVSYLGVRLEKAKKNTGAFVPRREQYADYINDSALALPMQRDIAVAFLSGEPILLEGGTSLGKTTTVRKMCAELGYEVHYVNLTGETDVENLMGRYLPNHDKKNPEDPEYVFSDGKVTTGLRQEYGRIKVIILDEYNASKPEVLIRLHEVLDAIERDGDVVLSEDASEVIPTNRAKTKIVALTNTPGKGFFGREPLDPAQLRRWVYRKLPAELPEATLTTSMQALFGVAKEKSMRVPVGVMLASREEIMSLETMAEIPGLNEILARYQEFHLAAKQLLKARTLGADQPQLFTYDDRMEPRRVRDFIRRFYQGDLNDVFQQALEYYYAGKLETDADKNKLRELIKTVAVEQATDTRRKGATREPHAAVAPTEASEQSATPSQEFVNRRAMLDEEARVLRTELGVDAESESLTPEQLSVFNEIFGAGNLERSPLPKPEDLTDAYFDKMYPATQQDKDTQRGLTSYRPDWWNRQVDTYIVGPNQETWGNAYIRSMRKDLQDLSQTTVFLYAETIQKPNYLVNGQRLYGSIDGQAQGKDWLIPILQQVFGPDATRFNHTHDDLTTKLLPAVTKHINNAFSSKGIIPPNFHIILNPALLFNEQTTNRYPSNSTTNTWEWTSTILFKQDNTDSDSRLVVGHSDDGGAGNVRLGHRVGLSDRRGFRLAVVLDR